MKSYLEFEKQFYEGKTERYNVISKTTGFVLGRIMWENGWRQYIFSPSYPTIWSKGCLKEIEDFLQQLIDKRK